MLRESHWLGIEPATCKSQVQRPTAKPPHNAQRKQLMSSRLNSVNPAFLLETVLIPGSLARCTSIITRTIDTFITLQCCLSDDPTNSVIALKDDSLPGQR